jgi:hypothetical protein
MEISARTAVEGHLTCGLSDRTLHGPPTACTLSLILGIEDIGHRGPDFDKCTRAIYKAQEVQWPNRTGSGAVSNPMINAWFNVADFQSPGSYVFGNSGRNILFGPGTKQFDLSLFKNIAFNESGSRHLQFRAEAFNALNTPQFNNPNAQIGNTAAGIITSAGAPLLYQRTSRQLQLALKLYF